MPLSPLYWDVVPTHKVCTASGSGLVLRLCFVEVGYEGGLHGHRRGGGGGKNDGHSVVRLVGLCHARGDVHRDTVRLTNDTRRHFHGALFAPPNTRNVRCCTS